MTRPRIHIYTFPCVFPTSIDQWYFLCMQQIPIKTENSLAIQVRFQQQKSAEENLSASHVF